MTPKISLDRLISPNPLILLLDVMSSLLKLARVCHGVNDDRCWML